MASAAVVSRGPERGGAAHQVTTVSALGPEANPPSQCQVGRLQQDLISSSQTFPTLIWVFAITQLWDVAETCPLSGPSPQ